MKNYFAKNRLFQLLVALVAIGFYSMAQAQLVNVNVQVQLNGDQDKLEVTTMGQCGNNNHNGCIHVRKRDAGKNQFFVCEKHAMQQARRCELGNW